MSRRQIRDSLEELLAGGNVFLIAALRSNWAAPSFFYPSVSGPVHQSGGFSAAFSITAD